MVMIAALTVTAALHTPATAAPSSPAVQVSDTVVADTSADAAPQSATANGSPTKTPPHGVTVVVHPGKNSRVSGTALFQYDPVSGNTAMRLTLQGLTANSQQTAFINGARCDTLSPTLVPFNLLHGDRSGRGDAPAVFPGNFAGHGWSVQVHRGADPTSNADFFTVACGDIP